jgi:CBS domain-containing protein
MTPAPIVVEPDAEAVEAARLMLNNHINCLPVILGETVVGIVTTSDILIAFMEVDRRERRFNQASL